MCVVQDASNDNVSQYIPAGVGDIIWEDLENNLYGREHAKQTRRQRHKKRAETTSSSLSKRRKMDSSRMETEVMGHREGGRHVRVRLGARNGAEDLHGVSRGRKMVTEQIISM